MAAGGAEASVDDAGQGALPGASPRPASSVPVTELLAEVAVHGLLLVEESADDRGVLPGPSPCRTVWAEPEPGRFR
ncbi:hypothetical protein ACFY3N_27645 [Streptomyces sp. NPDC000348]|uniref:hypothetical protein n=1 Tax=Streptomyces sp. NPDC000348 TaxID=3364538 RepID=UPI0036819929